ncbi:MAG: ABC transporter permease [Lachnospiraceae bacterium]|nr:ABC transporter permease [Lachnospiraceae bacterium]
MQLLAMIKKEIKVLFRNRILFFANVFIPIMIILINIIYTGSATTNIVIGFSGETTKNEEIMSALNSIREDINFADREFADEVTALEAYGKGETDCVLHSTGGGVYTVYYKEGNQRSEIAYQFVVAAMREINAACYSQEALEVILANQEVSISKVVSQLARNEVDMNSIIWAGFIWIFIYCNLSLSVNQMQQEKATKTLLYMCKAGARWRDVFLAKSVAGMVQFVVILVAFIVTTCCLNLQRYRFWFGQIAIWALAFFCVYSLGHLLGTLITNSALLVVVQMLMVFPLMIMNSMQSSVFDSIMKNNPLYCAMTIAKKAFLAEWPAIEHIAVCVVTVPACYLIIYLYLSKREPIKVCRVR